MSPRSVLQVRSQQGADREERVKEEFEGQFDHQVCRFQWIGVGIFS
jgi:hypothetical protein